jgi:hypothetical protein
MSSEQCYAAEHAVRSSSSLLLPPSQYAAGEMMLRRAEPPSVLPFVDLLLQYSAHNYHPLPMYVLCSLSARGSSRALGQCSLGATPRALGSPFASGLRCGDSSNSYPFSAFRVTTADSYRPPLSRQLLRPRRGCHVRRLRFICALARKAGQLTSPLANSKPASGTPRAGSTSTFFRPTVRRA